MAITDSEPPAPASAPDPPPPVGPATGAQPGRVRARLGELISASSATALLVVMLTTAWYGVAGVPDPSAARPAVSGTETGWQALSLVRWVAVVCVLVCVGAVLLHISQQGHGSETDTSRVVTLLGLLCSALLVYRVLIVLPASEKVLDQKLGAVLGVFCALGIALGGHVSIRAEVARGHARSRAR